MKFPLPSKDELRQTMNSQRRELAREEVIVKSYNVFENFMNEIPVKDYVEKAALVYANFDNEVSTGAIIHYLTESRIWIAMPRYDIIRGSGTLHYVVDPAEDLIKGKHGIREPKPDAPVCDPGDIALIIAPGVAFDTHGNRLGRGKGWYDWLFRRYPEPLRIGLAYDFQIRSAIPHSGQDEAVDFIVTESDVLVIEPRRRK